MPCDKDFGYVTLTRGLTWERYGDLWQLTCVTMSETTPKDHLIILREFLVGNKARATSSSIRARVNCSQASVKLHLSCTVCQLTVCWGIDVCKYHVDFNLVWLGMLNSQIFNFIAIVS